MSNNSTITIVSGLPRSGTSLMMQMLEAGGMEVATDGIRRADVDNPRGYFELEKVKGIKADSSWLPESRGRVFKMVSQLLYDLPPTENYQIIFMERDLEEVLESQEKMLRRLGKDVAPRGEMTRFMATHIERLKAWLRRQKNIRCLFVNYNILIKEPQTEVERIADFLDRPLNREIMTQAIDLSLYRNRA